MTLTRRLLLALALAAAALPAAAQQPPDTYREITRNAVEGLILPAVSRFADRTRALEDAAEAHCAAPDAEALKAAYQDAFDAWIAVSPYRFGPAEAEGRALAIAFWPDPKGFGRRALDGLLSDEDPVVGSEESFRQVSIAARGFFALERLIFEVEAASGYPCRLLAAVARDLAAIASELDREWREDQAPAMLSAGEGSDLYRSAEEPVRALFTALRGEMELTLDKRLGLPLGTFDRPRPRLAEAWRSGRSLRNVALSVEALRALTAAFAPALTGDEAAALDAVWARALEVTERAPRPIAEAVEDPGARLEVESAQTAIRAARDRVGATLAPALGLTAGFNSADGD